MALEIERRHLVSDPHVVGGLTGTGNEIVQGYFFARNGYAARVRRIHIPAGGGSMREGPAMITVKGPRSGLVRNEYEMEVDPEFALALLRLIEHKVSKTRYQLIEEGETWEIDVFHGDNGGLMIAECETETAHKVRIPSWCGQDITMLRKYDNENLAMRPYRTWRDNRE